MAGLAFTPKPTSPAALPPMHVMLDRATAKQPDATAALRSAVLHVTHSYLRLAQHMTPAEMEALIWQHVSRDGADHGESCAAFASLMLHLGSQLAGQQSWVSGGGSYPWPLHPWADVRVDENLASPGVTSVVQDAQAHGRWRPLGDGYIPQGADWVVFDGHVEVVTSYDHGVLRTIGGDSVPNFSVNAHTYAGSFASEGVAGFVDNGAVPTPVARHANGHHHRHVPPVSASHPGQAAVPGVPATPPPPARHVVTTAAVERAGEADIPGLPAAAQHNGVGAAAGHYTRHRPEPTPPVHDTAAQQRFIASVAPGAIAAQHEYGVPAPVTIAQAIDESGWGQSKLATRDHNLFGIKGVGPGGSDSQPTQEYMNGQMVTQTAPFQVFHDVTQGIREHGRLIATSGFYGAAMGHAHNPDAFARALTGVYATDPAYGDKLVGLMKQYGLYHYGAPTAPVLSKPAPPRAPAHHEPPPRPSPPAPSPSVPAVPGVPAPAPAPPATQPVADGQPAHPSPDAQVPGLPGTATPPVQHAAVTAETRPVPARGIVDVPGTSTPAVFGRGAVDIPGAGTAAVTPARVAATFTKEHLHWTVKGAIEDQAGKRLRRGESVYRAVADSTKIPWQLLGSCDWMQCEAHPKLSPVHGERLSTRGPEGKVYCTKSAALHACAVQMRDLAIKVYGIDPVGGEPLSTLALARVFAAFRWGGVLKDHHIEVAEFPYSVAGLPGTPPDMRWPNVKGPDAPPEAGSKFRSGSRLSVPFGAAAVAVFLGYPATTEGASQ